jgi:hypothetical protein
MDDRIWAVTRDLAINVAQQSRILEPDQLQAAIQRGEVELSIAPILGASPVNRASPSLADDIALMRAVLDLRCAVDQL